MIAVIGVHEYHVTAKNILTFDQLSKSVYILDTTIFDGEQIWC